MNLPPPTPDQFKSTFQTIVNDSLDILQFTIFNTIFYPGNPGLKNQENIY